MRGSVAALFIGAACLFVAACGIDSDSLYTASVEDPSGTAPRIDMPPVTPSTTAPRPLGDDDLLAVAAEVQQWWGKELPAVYNAPYKPLTADRVVAGTPSANFPVCDRHQITYRDVRGNAFAAPCPEGLTVVWDANKLIPEIAKKYGPVAAAIVLAHEWGHIAQFEAKVDSETVVLEQQADCFAGAWLNHLVEDPGTLGDLSKQNPLDSAVSSIVEFRDAPGSSPTAAGAHGTGFDRVRALQEGYTKGAEFCAGYPDKGLPLIDLRLPDGGGSGNLPLDQLVNLVVPDLNTYYKKVVAGFKGASVDAVLNNPDAMRTLEDLSTRIGDNAAGLVLAMIWAGFAQDQVGGNEGRDDAGRLQQRACLAGGWLADVYNDTVKNGDTGTGGRELQLTAGDLDEAILGLVDLASNQGMTKNTNGAVFRIIGSLRQGVVDGFDSCGLGK